MYLNGPERAPLALAMGLGLPSSNVPPPPVVRPQGYAPSNGERPLLDREPGWWEQPYTRVALVGGVGLLGLGLLYLMLGRGEESYTPNLKAGTPRSKAPKGKIRTVKGGRRFGHRTPPKRYWGMGARRKGDFAWPEGYKYPLVFRYASGKVNVKRTKAHIRSAKAYFKRSKHLYPKDVRQTIAKRINAASRRYKVGPTVVKP